ncbi:hypothetical protein Hanom_Chr04g00360851 [Helianthus anomalus]
MNFHNYQISRAVRVSARSTIVNVATPTIILARLNIIAIGLLGECVYIFRSSKTV